MSTPKILAWDIERSPIGAYRWSLFSKSPVALNQMIHPSGTISFAARWYGTPKKDIIYRDIRDDDFLETAYQLLDEADSLLSWNGKGFDTKHMKTEFARMEWAPFSPVHEIDMLRDVKREFNFDSNKLDHIAAELLGKTKVQHEGFDLWVKCMNGDEQAWNRMRRYNEGDVHLLIDLYDRLLPWLKLPNRNLFDGDGDSCRACVSKNLEKRGFYRTNIGKYQRYRCLDCGAWSHSGKSLDRVELR